MTRIAIRLVTLVSAIAASASCFSPAAVAAEPEPYTVTVDAAAAKPGAASTAQVTIKPAKGYHMNKEFPVSLKLVAPAGVDLAKPTLDKNDAKTKVEETAVVFGLGYTQKEAGKKTITGKLSFAVCSETSCNPQHAQVTIPVEAK